ncbi:hypothetical protein FRACYDRAFT_229943 [Fragilariopsis cylindrus CCMP1102]|uniref:PhyH-domain-containing protein n=1 Tax=Fragilariopsis cylindrus CCMP1102 TaxID=635003 RepID=A0A1E7EM83_9STRA|nr:hypothetical protein FRACYDRAFT_229943 [Fragilariopsis cylindrus CCMP1102]|eukprot:OEU07004.1 hypothetical protein FRACYDRAFT_229943 [Fragilariopsis cylindrus CCMP1102]
MERRANEEELLLLNTKSKSKSNNELMSPKIKPKPPKSGKGFGSTGSSNSDNDTIENRIAIEQCKILQRDGVIKISNVLSNELADELREYVLQQQLIASNVVEKASSDTVLKVSKSFYGVENSRTGRCDLQLSLLNGGYLSDGNENENDDESKQNPIQQHTIADTLNALLGSGSGVGTLRHIYENLVTRDGEFYELAAVITNPGSKRQQIHPDLPYQDKDGAPLYVVFLALQDITNEMGPTTFLLKTHNSKSHQIKQFLSNDIEVKNKQLLTIASQDNVKKSTLQKGDCVIFDARILHCGNANLSKEEGGNTRVLFNFSFRNPTVQGNLGYPGSIRPGYIKKMNLNDMINCLDKYNNNNNDDPFQEYGDGLLH